MKIIRNRDKGTAICENHKFTISNNIKKKLQTPNDYSCMQITGNQREALRPQKFPPGLWNVTGLEETENPEFAPVIILTDASQKLPIWTLDSRGNYRRRTKKTLAPRAKYALHHSNTPQTIGCGFIAAKEQALELARLIRAALAKEEPVRLEVTPAAER
jgi:hypothetical protein